MRLSHSSSSLHPGPVSRQGLFVGARTPASAFTREQRILARYRHLLYAVSTDVEALMRTLWGDALTRKQMYGDIATDGKVDRLDHSIPDLIKLLLPEEQYEVEALLLAGDLVGTIRHLLAQERTLTQREESRKVPGDDGHALAAGLGRLNSESYGCRHPNAHLRAAAQSSESSDAATPATSPHPAPHPLPPCQLRPKRRTLQGQARPLAAVKKAQERKRLKRKRRR